MTRKSRRELENELADLDDTADSTGPDEIVIRRTVVGTTHDGSGLAEGETETTEKVIEL